MDDNKGILVRKAKLPQQVNRLMKTDNRIFESVEGRGDNRSKSRCDTGRQRVFKAAGGMEVSRQKEHQNWSNL